MDVSLNKSEIFLPIFVTTCYRIGISGFLAIGIWFVDLILAFKVQLFLFLLNFFAIIWFLKRIKFNINICVEYVPKGHL